ncbi:MAG: hypothetical protein ACLGIN_13675, partial [Candidatus Sericytochromatia bacterium]
MEISRIRALRGPNLWSRHTAVEALVNCDASERQPADPAAFEARLRARFPGIGALQPLGGVEPVSMAHALALSALALQAQAGC